MSSRPVSCSISISLRREVAYQMACLAQSNQPDNDVPERALRLDLSRVGFSGILLLLVLSV
jgi:hypothetical protein